MTNRDEGSVPTEHTPTPKWKHGSRLLSVVHDNGTVCEVICLSTHPIDGEGLPVPDIVTACNRDHLFEEVEEMLRNVLFTFAEDESYGKLMADIDDLLTRIDASKEESNADTQS